MAAAMVAASALFAAGCATGGQTDTPPPAAPHQQQSTFNQADVAFAQGMVPHHRQAIEMADQVPSRTTNPAVVGLADRIRAAQQPEIDQLSGWLAAWGAAGSGGHEGHAPAGQPDQGHGEHGQAGQSGDGMGHDMAGMMSAEDMRALEQARGPAFDEMWLRMMIEHHRGAVDMAATELRDGRNPEAKAMAQRITDSQRAEIDEMTALLGR
ncbi:protein of unknown function DUF305 [Saccharopolyspora erythraea NRRL 2338]|uniref:DUF305 domain-containing protein n=1 Tax=Saccharopolyspora erythraea (strain ATCC 11635 / DSM 40517 / JCM 4748 / NBRC 13426 / NCIMB 8594 / NRRL 2338) TaxID=405948 RepID=A4FQF6_SACEN|nr:hypothetical protein N599_08615 [Saccharopolyspora erythraea D]CAM06281.1 protein of unknown function DUF305 [Saccharopolyspora erythraea NRRL 2338]